MCHCSLTLDILNLGRVPGRGLVSMCHCNFTLDISNHSRWSPSEHGFTVRPVYKCDFSRATQCNFDRAEVATSCHFIGAILVQFVSARPFRQTKVVLLLKSETATQSHRFSYVTSQTAAIICTKFALKSQLVYTRDFEVATSVRQKLYIARQKSPV